jgi:hypothetical protein
MTTIYLHIGLPKTGTSSIQSFLLDNRDNLLHKGFLYPLAGRPNASSFPQIRVGHHKLAHELTQEETGILPSSVWADVQQEIKTLGSENVIISAEYFTLILESEKISNLKNYLSEYETKIVIYLRRQDDYLTSLYCEKVKMGLESCTLQEFIKQNKPYGNYYNLLQMWCQYFGQENLIIRVYEKSQFKNGLINDFLNSIGFPLEASQMKYNYFSLSSNVSQSRKATKIMQRLNKINGGNTAIQKRLKRKMVSLYHDVLSTDNSVSNLILKIPNSIISDELISVQDRINLLQEFAESNRRVAQEYLERESGQLFYSTLEPIL